MRDRIERIYAQGFRSIAKQDLRSRLRWWGLYTQRKQGVPGERTGDRRAGGARGRVLHAADPDPRRPALERAAPRDRWASSERFGRDVADVTDRQNIQLHWIRIEDVPAIWEGLEAVGLSTQEACGDTPRVMLGCPLAGVDADEIIDATPTILETERRFIGDPAFSNLPRKYKTSITGCRQQCAQHEINDFSFVGVEHGARPRLRPLGRRRTLDEPACAQRLGVFVEPGRVPDVWVGVTSLFRDYGYRRQRNHARLKFLVADWGAERFREVLEGEYLGRPAPRRRRAAAVAEAQRDHVGVFEQHDGHVYVGFAPRAGRIAGHQLREVAELADTFGEDERPRPQQKMVIVDVDPEARRRARRRARSMDLRTRPSTFRKGHDGLHRDRVLQARDHRDEGPRDAAHARAGASACPTSTRTSGST